MSSVIPGKAGDRVKGDHDTCTARGAVVPGAALAGPEQLLRNVVLFSWLLGRYREQGRVVRSVGKVGGHLPDREVGLDDPELDRKVQRGRWWRIGLSCAITKYNDQFCFNMEETARV